MMFSTGAQPSSVAVSDFNNDTRPDIAVANVVNSNVDILLGNGNGSFTAQTTFPTQVGPYSVAVGDFNNDARLDMAFVNEGIYMAGVILGYGTGCYIMITPPLLKIIDK